MRRSTKIVAMDIHTDSIVVAVAEPGRKVPRLFGTIASTSEAVAKLAEQLGGPSTRLRFCCEAGPCGCGVYRQLTALGHECTLEVPTRVSQPPGRRAPSRSHTANILRNSPAYPPAVAARARDAARGSSSSSRTVRRSSSRVSRLIRPTTEA